MEKPKTTPKDFFLYVGAMLTLYWSAGSLLTLLFTIIDTVFPDALNYYTDPYSSGIRFAIASLVVIFPICLLLLRAVKKDASANPEKLSLAIRKWFYAFTIFLTAVAMAVDLIVLLNTFLGGEITSRFIQKVLAVLIVSGIVFWYALLEIRLKPETPVSVRKEFLYGAPILVLAAIVFGFVIMGSPSAVRSLRFDERRVGDLQTIQWQIVSYSQQKNMVPKSLAVLEDSISGYRNPTDPRTGEAYQFVPGEGRTFTLCATFERPSVSTSVAKPYAPIGEDTWNHEAGKKCFERTIDPDFYPNTKR